MTDLVLIKTAGGALVPADPQAIEYVSKLKMGAGVTASVKKHNNPAFHRKMFALFTLAFESWEPAAQEYKGQIVQKNFDQFRKDLTILAGYYESTINLRGEVRLIAKSLNFSAMGQEEREAVYSAVINVILSKLLTNYTREDLDATVERVLMFS
jgi:hypothetical protein